GSTSSELPKSDLRMSRTLAKAFLRRHLTLMIWFPASRLSSWRSTAKEALPRKREHAWMRPWIPFRAPESGSAACRIGRTPGDPCTSPDTLNTGDVVFRASVRIDYPHGLHNRPDPSGGCQSMLS